MRLSAQTKRPENNTKLPDLDKITKRLEISLRATAREFESHRLRQTKPLKAEAFKGFIYEYLLTAKRLRQFKSETLLIFILQTVPPADVIL